MESDIMHYRKHKIPLILKIWPTNLYGYFFQSENIYTYTNHMIDNSGISLWISTLRPHSDHLYMINLFGNKLCLLENNVALISEIISRWCLCCHTGVPYCWHATWHPHRNVPIHWCRTSHWNQQLPILCSAGPWSQRAIALAHASASVSALTPAFIGVAFEVWSSLYFSDSYCFQTYYGGI